MEQVTGQYHVFINHRGPDTKLNIAGLINRELKRCGLNVFLDREIRKGDKNYSAIREAIRSASVHIALFSKRYPESDWCLNELCWMLNSSHQCTTIPVFYDVQPSDLKETDREPYATAFQNNPIKTKKDVEKWKQTLKEASFLSGYIFQTGKSDYAQFLDEIVERVLEVVKWDSPDVAKYPVGLDQALDDLQNKIQQKCGTKVVGISGFGGIGKSTLAKHFFKARRSKFDRSCYLGAVKDGDLASLQRLLLHALQANITEIPNTDFGKGIFQNTVRGLKILIVIDDVNDRRQIKNLLDIDAVEPGSLILITGRDENILRCSCPANTLLYDMQPLQRQHAQELFCHHAFGRQYSEPPEEYQLLVGVFLNFCEGFPLCLEVLGEQLNVNRNITYWTETLETASKGMPLRAADPVREILKVSYNAMGSGDQELFLDIGYFFVGEDADLAVRVLEVLGYHNVQEGLESLRQKCFLKFDNDVDFYHEKDENPYRENQSLTQTPCKYGDNYLDLEFNLPGVLRRVNSKIIMHNQVRDLAKSIVGQNLGSRDKPQRLSCEIDIKIILDSQFGSDPYLVRGIRTPKGQDPTHLTNHNPTAFLKGLRLLVLEHSSHLRSFFDSAISWNLVWLRLRNLGGFKSIDPSAISLQSLRVLEFQGSTDHLENSFSHLKNLFNERNDEIPSRLLELNIDAKGGVSAGTASSHESAMPSFYSFLGWIGTKLTYLNKIVLKNVLILESLPIDFSKLTDLRHLDLSGSINLTNLPTSMSQLLKLQHLALRDCRNLSIPRDILGEISTLEYVDFKGCAQLEHLPEGIASQTRLRSLILLDTNLLEFPMDLDLLKLEQLRISSKHLTKITGSGASLKGLKELILLGCVKLDNITPIENLNLLERLEIYEAALPPILPLGILRLKNIKDLKIDFCPIAEFYFQADHVMDALRHFSARSTEISNICIPTDVCPRLEEIDLSYCSRLMLVQGLPCTLVRLILKGCSGLKTLTNLSNLVHLRFLNLNGCFKLETVNVKGMASLEEIGVEQCWNLQSIEAFNELERVNTLHVSTNLHGNRFSNASEFDSLMRQCIVSKFENLQVRDVSAATTVRSPARLHNVRSHHGIVMCFITNRSSGNNFCVSFDPSNSHGLYEVYKTFRESRSHGRMLHMYMWTEDSKLFKEKNLNTKLAVYHSGSGNEFDVRNLSTNCASDRRNNLDEEKGWIVTLASKSQGSKVCREIMLEGLFKG